MAAWSWPSGAPSSAAAASIGGDARASPTTSKLVVGELPARAGHRVDAGVAAADERDRVAGAGQLDGRCGALLLRAEPGREDPRAGPEQVGDLVTYWSRPTTTDARRSSAHAPAASADRGRRGRCRRWRAVPRGLRRAMAAVAMALLRLADDSRRPGRRRGAAASATLGVPTAARTTSLGFGTSTAARLRRVEGAAGPRAPRRFEQARLVGFGVDRASSRRSCGQLGLAERRADELEHLVAR